MAIEQQPGLESLTDSLPLLNSAIAEATGVVHAVDHFLTEELPVGPWVASRPFETQRAIGDDGRELLVTSHLACGRVAGKYRLHVLNVTLDRADGKDQFTQIVGEERTPWMTCSREMRLQSFAMLPELLTLLAGKINEIAVQTNRTVETVREVLNSLGKGHVPAIGSVAPPALIETEEEDDFAAAGVLITPGGSDLFKRPKVK